jgi:Glycosyl hydrolase catalytic core
MRWSRPAKLVLTIATLVGVEALLPSAGLIHHPDYGVVTSVQFLDGPTLARLQELGVGSVRIDMGWNLVEHAQDQFDFTQLQTWVDQGHAAGLHIYMSLGDAPEWAAPCGECMPYDLLDWYDYVYHVIAHFRYVGNEVTFGIWNEPNLDVFLTPDLYVDLFNYANQARLDANRAARLGVPETEHGAVASGWFSQVMNSIGPRLQPQDVITVHWYPGLPGRSPDLTLYMEDVVQRVGGRETWLTETGKFEPDDANQAAGIRDIVMTFNRRRTSQWARIFIYRLYGGNPPDNQTPYQLLRADYSPRPSFDAYRSIMYRIFSVSVVAANGRYLTAADAGGYVRANSDTAGPDGTFELDDLNGGSLQSGDLVRLRSSSGAYFHVAARNRPLLANDACGCNDDSLFVVATMSDDPTAASAAITLQSSATGDYASLDGGRASDVFMNARSAGPRETFRLVVH